MELILPQPGMVLEGPVVKHEFFDGAKHSNVLFEIWIRPGGQKHFDPRRHPKMVSEAYDLMKPETPNPCLIPLDPGEEGGPFVYGKITIVSSIPNGARGQ